MIEKKCAPSLKNDANYCSKIKDIYVFIYQITNLINNKIYIGRSKKKYTDLLQRYQRETLNVVSAFITKSIKPRPINLAMFLYGEDKFIFKILIDNINSYNELIKLEEKTIAEKNSRNREIGYNVSAGGADNNTTGGKNLDLSWKNNISRGVKKRFENPLERLKISQRTSGKKNPMHGISVRQRMIDKYGVVIGEQKYQQWKINIKNSIKPPLTKEQKQKISIMAKKSWQKKEIREKRLASLKNSTNPFFKKNILTDDVLSDIEKLLKAGVSIHKICMQKELTIKVCYRNFKEKYGDKFNGFKSMVNSSGEKYFEENNIKLDKKHI